MKKETYIHDGKNFGEIYDNTIYVSHRDAKKHMYRGGLSSLSQAIKQGKAMWGINNDVLRDLDSLGVKLIVINDAKEKKAYYTTIDSFLESKIFLDFGYGLQRFLPLSAFNTTNNYIRVIEACRIALGA
jgi:hypothetical protein